MLHVKVECLMFIFKRVSTVSNQNYEILSAVQDTVFDLYFSLIFSTACSVYRGQQMHKIIKLYFRCTQFLRKIVRLFAIKLQNYSNRTRSLNFCSDVTHRLRHHFDRNNCEVNELPNRCCTNCIFKLVAGEEWITRNVNSKTQKKKNN